MGIDSHKRQQPSSDAPLFVIQSSTAFAERYLDAPDLQSVGQQLLECAARSLLPWLASPDVLQVHRWRYAFASRPLQERCLPVADPLPLVCSGDWCGGNQLEHALESGLAAADNISFLLNKTLPNHTFARLLQHISH